VNIFSGQKQLASKIKTIIFLVFADQMVSGSRLWLCCRFYCW